MKDETCLLIDYENFFLQRERDCGVTGYTEQAAQDDLAELTRFVRETYPESRLNVRRAYADYTARRWLEVARRTDFYLREAPRWLMRYGIEPVQVFRFRRGLQHGNQPTKNSADIRMGMDAVRLMTDDNRPAHFVIVTSDTDFVPVVNELRRMGAEVAGVGLKGSTSEALPAYCDRFIYFNDLIASRVADGDGEAEDVERMLPAVREALASLLLTRGPMLFAAVQPLLSRRLGNHFDPKEFGCDNTGDFLRRYQDQLGVRFVRDEHDYAVVPAQRPAQAADVSGASRHLRRTSVADDARGSARPGTLGGQDGRDERLDKVARALTVIVRRRGRVKFASLKHQLDRELGGTFDPTPYGLERLGDFFRKYADSFGLRAERGVHDWELCLGRDAPPLTEEELVSIYREALRRGQPALVPLQRATETAVTKVFGLCSDQTNPTLTADQLRDAVEELLIADVGETEARPRAVQVVLQLQSAGCLIDSGGESVRLAPDLTNVAAATERLNRYLVSVLRERTAPLGRGTATLRPAARVLFGEEPTAHELEQLSAWLGG